MSSFRRATKSTARLRMALVGPSGSGKTYSALAIAAGIAPQGRIAVIDTEHGSASKYGDLFTFDVLELANFDPRNYIEAIQAAEGERFDVLVIDSLTHAWTGKGGALEQVDRAAKRSRSNNTFTAWRDVTPLHNSLVDAIIACRCHVLATMRTKVEYAMEADPTTGKMSPRKIGMAPIQREGMDYEFDIVADLDLDHNLIVGKTRCRDIDGAVVRKPGPVFGQALAAWLSDGTPNAAIPPAALPAETVGRLTELIARTGMTEHQVRSALANRGVAAVERLSVSDATDLINKLEHVASRAEFSASIGTASIGTESADTDNSTSDDHEPDDHEIAGTVRVPRGEAEHAGAATR